MLLDIVTVKLKTTAVVDKPVDGVLKNAILDKFRRFDLCFLTSIFDFIDGKQKVCAQCVVPF